MCLESAVYKDCALCQVPFLKGTGKVLENQYLEILEC